MLKKKKKKKKLGNLCLVFTSPTDGREVRKLHVVVVQRQHTNVQKSMMHVKTVVLIIKTY